MEEWRRSSLENRGFNRAILLEETAFPTVERDAWQIGPETQKRQTIHEKDRTSRSAVYIVVTFWKYSVGDTQGKRLHTWNFGRRKSGGEICAGIAGMWDRHSNTGSRAPEKQDLLRGCWLALAQVHARSTWCWGTSSSRSGCKYDMDKMLIRNDAVDEICGHFFNSIL